MDIKFYISSNGHLERIMTPEKIVIPSGVTVIGNGVFEANPDIKEVVLPEGLLEIGARAFRQCDSLEKITLPSTLKVIGEEAFRDCGSLKEITLPKGLERIERGAFFGCGSIKEIEIPEKITKIEHETLYLCKSLLKVTLPCGIEEISDYAIANCEKLCEISIPNTVSTLGQCAFYGCTSLKSITIPESVLNIGEECFLRCFSLDKITLPSVLLQSEAKLQYLLSRFGDKAYIIMLENKLFQKPSALKSKREKIFLAVLDAKRQDLVLPFLSLWKNRTIDDLDEFIKISNDKGFAEGTSILLEYKRKKFSKTQIENHAQDKLDKELGFKERTLSEWRKIFKLSILGENAVITGYRSDTSDVIIPEYIAGHKVTQIMDNAFYANGVIKSVIIPDTVVKIGKSAFQNCPLLESVTLSQNLTHIGDDAFSTCAKLTEITFPKSLEYIGHRSFMGDGQLKSVEFSSKVKLGSFVFFSCKSLSIVKMETSLDGLEDTESFKHCSALADSDGFVTLCGVLFDYVGKKSEICNLPSNITKIGQSAFDSLDIEKIDIPSRVEKISKFAFRCCKKLKEVVIFGKDMVIEDEAFKFTSLGLEIVAPKDSLASKFAERTGEKFKELK